MRIRSKLEIAVKCNYCKNQTEVFVVNAEGLRFCRIQIPGYPADKDCLEDYIRNKNVQKKEKEEGLFTQEKVGIQKEEIKLTNKTTALKKLEALKQFLNDKKHSNLNLK
tara:strand:- start:395 stop:721 length:327 start_codon:yes stop_codon:yes gene_type:complete